MRDYKIATGSSERLHTSSPFNIKVESLTMRNFYAEEVSELYQQHTADSGQVFTADAMQLVFDLTQGQPWLVNAIARQLVEVVAPEPSIIVTATMVEAAKETLIRRQDTHLDSLAERLREDRVKAIIEPMLAGMDLGNIPNEDIQFIQDLGSCRMDPQGGLVIMLALLLLRRKVAKNDGFIGDGLAPFFFDKPLLSGLTNLGGFLLGHKHFINSKKVLEKLIKKLFGHWLTNGAEFYGVVGKTIPLTMKRNIWLL